MIFVYLARAIQYSSMLICAFMAAFLFFAWLKWHYWACLFVVPICAGLGAYSFRTMEYVIKLEQRLLERRRDG